MDDAAIAALRDLYSDLDIDGRVLDLGGGGPAHFDVPPDELVDGDPGEPLPYADREFDDALCSGRVGALTAEAFAEIARVLKPGGRFVCTFAGDEGPPDDASRVRLVRTYFARTPGFGPAESDLRTSLTGAGDRLWAVWARRLPDAG
jgi:SAM-dependent methyltransferase